MDAVTVRAVPRYMRVPLLSPIICLQAHLTALNWRATQYIYIRWVLQIIICKPIWRRSTEELTNIFASNVSCKLLFANPFVGAQLRRYSIFASDVFCILLFASPFDGTLQLRSDSIFLHPMLIASCYLQAHLTALLTEELPNIFASNVYCILLLQAHLTALRGATQYICIRCVLHIVICKPIWRRYSLRSYPTYLHPMCLAHCYCKPIRRRSSTEEIPNIFASDVYCILFVSPFDDATQLRSYPINLHPMCLAYWYLQARLTALLN